MLMCSIKNLLFLCVCAIILYELFSSYLQSYNFVNISPFISYKKDFVNDPPKDKFLIKYKGKKLCIDDSGAVNPGYKIYSYSCDPGNINQQFSYNAENKLISNPNKNNLCIDDSGVTEIDGNKKMLMQNCDKKNNNQHFVYNKDTEQIMAADKNNLCIDTSAANQNGVSLYLNQCDSNNINEKFELLNTKLHGKVFKLKNKFKDNLCVHPGKPNEIKAYSMTCNDNNNMKFIYDTVNKQLKKANDTDWCLTDNGSIGPDINNNLYLFKCSDNNANQQFIYDFKNEMWKNPNKNLCIDDTGITENDGTNLYLYHCSTDNINQKFSIIDSELN